MTKRFIALLILLAGLLHAGEMIVSGIPLPRTYVINLDPYPCDEACLNLLLEQEQLFSLLAYMQRPSENEMLNEQRAIYSALFNIEAGGQGPTVRIAMLLPDARIGRYAFSTTNSVLAYMLEKNRHFELKTFSIGDESNTSVRQGLQQIMDEGFNYVIAPTTKTGAKRVMAAMPPMNIFFPTVHRSDVNATGNNFNFGGIDYRAQIDQLMQFAQPPLLIFYDDSALGEHLKSMTIESYVRISGDPTPFRHIHTYAVDKHRTNLKGLLKTNTRLTNASVFLNTPLIKSGMIMSQLTLYEVNATAVLSTQINYDPLLFDITQPADRTTMLLTSVIGKQSSVLIDTNALLENNIRYDWINYATTIGADYFYHLASGMPREYRIPIVDHQVAYPVNVYRPGRNRFDALDIELINALDEQKRRAAAAPEDANLSSAEQPL